MRTISAEEIEDLLSDRSGIDPSVNSLLLPAPPAGVPLANLGLSTRAFNGLLSIGADRDPAMLGEMTLGEFLAIPAVGNGTLRDYLKQSRRWNHPDNPAALCENTAEYAARLLSLAKSSRPVPQLFVSPMPAPPSITPLSALRLDARTANALRRAGYTADVSGLARLTVKQAMNLRGFGIVCVRVYLDAVVRWCESASASTSGNPSLNLLDRIITAVTTGRLVAIGHLHLPDPPEGVSLSELDLSVRSSNCLRRAGVDGRTRRLSQIQIEALMATHAFGVKSLLDVARRLRHAHQRAPVVSPSAMPAVKPIPKPISMPPRIAVDPDLPARLAQLAAAIRLEVGESEIDWSDPRFRDRLQEARVRSVAALAEALEAAKPGAARLEAIGRDVLETLSRGRRLSLEEEALEVAGIPKGSRGERILRARLGFGDLVSTTLKAVGSEHGVTRERIRQICHPPHLARIARRGYLPVLRGVLEQIAAALPDRCDRIEQELVAQGRVERGTEVGEILAYARSMGISFDAVESRPGDARLVSTRSDAEAIARLRGRMSRAINLDGAFMLPRLLDTMPKAEQHSSWECLAGCLLKGDSALRVLSGEPNWISAADVSQTALMRRIGEVLRVSGPIDPSELRRALRREYRRGGFVPTTAVLTEMVGLTECLHLESSGRVAWNPAIPLPELRGDGAIIVRVLEECGGIAERRAWQTACEQAGVSVPSFGRQSSYSPLVRKLGRGVFGLVGRIPRAGEIEAIQATIAPVRGGLLDRGWTSSGEYWISTVLSSAAFETGVLPVPVAARGMLRDAYH
jgi:hypothetical protein